MTTPTRFDVCGPLPRGTTMLEASAGTGKTYTIEALATQFVAEGPATLPQLLVIAYGRAASAELRERIRARMLTARDALADPGSAAQHHDEVVRHLAAAPPREMAARRERLAEAVASFDEATIVTTHQFCQRALASLGVGADVDPRETFVQDLGDLTAEVVADLYVRTFGSPQADPPLLSADDATQIARSVIADPQAALAVPEPAAGSAAEQRHSFARAVRAEVERRSRQRSLVTYHDLVGRLADALSPGDVGDRNRAWLRTTYTVVMVDEFQDTDQLQWQILRDAFHGSSDLILIGDPKQAIYGFRGGDVVTYLIADREATNHLTLGDNHRSDSRLVAAVSNLFGTVPLGHDRIRLTPVTGQHDTRLRGPDTADPLRVRLLPWAGRRPLPTQAARTRVAEDVADDIHHLLTAGNELYDDELQQWRPVAPGDIAVLVLRWKDAEDVGAALAPLGIRIVTTGSDSVFASPAARHWLALLRSLDQPHHGTLLRAAMLTPMLGYAGEQLAVDGDRHADEAAQRLRSWASDLSAGGVSALLHSITAEGGVLATALRHPAGERELTDLRHVAEALHERSRDTPTAGALAAWLSARISEAAGDHREQVQRRVDSDADAVQVLTVFGSKGLEYPIVYVPFAWNRWPEVQSGILRYHDGDRRVVDPLGPNSRGFDTRKDRHLAEEAGETLRQLYVAVTRASRQVILWWAPAGPRGKSTDTSALHRVLGARLSGHDSIDPRYPCEVVTAPALTTIDIPAVVIPRHRTGAPPPLPAPDPRVAAALATAPFDRVVDTSWRRTSYSGLTAAAHEYAFSAEVATGEQDDEPADTASDGEGLTDADIEPTIPAGLLSPMADLPKGATFGTSVHRVLELVTTAGADPAAALLAASAVALTDHPVAGVTPAALTSALAPVVTTRLGHLAGDATLWQIPPGDRLPELDFEFPLAPGDEPVLLGDVADLLHTHLPADDPLAEYPDRLRRDGLAPTRLHGFLSGSIDAVLRVGRPDAPRFLVTDYKTNWLGSAPAGALLVQDHDPASMAAAMLNAHYPLQALLYSVALHRYLRWRLPGYTPQTHLGGVLYLFVRGMAGPDTLRPPDGAAPFGVFSWQPGARLVTELSDVLDGRRP